MTTDTGLRASTDEDAFGTGLALGMAKRTTPVALVVVLLLLAGLALPAAAPAKFKAITGKLSKSGYTLIALADSGKAKSVRVKHATFLLRPPAKLVTLQLRSKDGLYAGPVVVGQAKKGKRGIVGVKAGAKLGKVVVKPGKGYAKLKKKLAKKWLAPGRWARAKKGVPIGAGNFGHVRSLNANGPASDPDRDGVPNALDVDDDGDLVLDDLDRSSATTARTSQATPGFQFHSTLPLPPQAVVNANAATLTTEDVDVALSSSGYLTIGVLPGESAELDCGGQPDPNNPNGWLGGLSYCTRGGTGRALKGDGLCCSPQSAWPRFPDDFDPDHNGYGTLPQIPITPPGITMPGFFILSHGATTAQIGTGDVVIQRVTTGGVETQFPATLQYVFATTPALASYSDTAGDSRTVSYPISPGGPGTPGNGFPLSAPPGEDVVLTLTSWRPQRQRLSGDPLPGAGESDTWTDIGGLNYTVKVQHLGMPGTGQEVAKECPQSTLFTTDPNLSALTPQDVLPNNYPGFKDSAPDRPASPANTFTYALNLTQCLSLLGVAWEPGEDIHLTFMAISPNAGGDAEETVVFTRK
jgi:hypothetical protein